MNVSALETLLEGVALPAERRQLLDHARHQRATPEELRTLASLPEDRYASLNDVAERLRPVQPQTGRSHPAAGVERDAPPGGSRYAP